jgi:deoxyribodipyrimidine photo-lyase
MIQSERIEILSDAPIRQRRYVLYWMQAAQRAEYNHALEHAIDRANELKKAVVVAFALTADFPEANARHYHFMLEGLRATQEDLQARGIRMIVRAEAPPKCVARMAKEACLVVVDAGHLRVQRQWRAEVAESIDCRFEQVETNLIVPVEEAAEKENFSAGTFRPRISKKLDRYLVKLRHRKPRVESARMRFDAVDLRDTERIIRELKVDTSVVRVAGHEGGTGQAKARLKVFLEEKLAGYSDQRNDPNVDGQSNLSPYLHFGQISPLYIALEVKKRSHKAKAAFLEELIVRRELSHNFVYYNDRYDSIECLPPWATRTLNYHERDERDHVYSREEFESARTHDPYWNAAQREMIYTGKMHGYMRMYWGKKILEWTRTPRQGFDIALHLNNKYELDGRDPNGFAGVAWCFGKHDRAWAERPVFGKIRYMNANGLKRKFDPEAYVAKVRCLAGGP